MDKFINYYYGMNVNNIVKDSNRYFFEYDNKRYMLKMYNDIPIDNYYEELKHVINNYRFFFNIVPNVAGKFTTVINGNNYVLLKLSNINDDYISIFDIKIDMFINNDANALKIVYHDDWEHLWERKIDYFEKYIDEKKERYSELQWIYDYVIGMGELALTYLKEANKVTNRLICDNLTIQHKRLNTKTKLYDYYDPTNVIIDHSSRDLCEYVKSIDLECFEKNVLDEYFDRYHLSKYWAMLFYSRILFPSFIFDDIENMINENKETKMTKNKLEKSIINNMGIIDYIGDYLKSRFDISIVKFQKNKMT